MDLQILMPILLSIGVIAFCLWFTASAPLSIVPMFISKMNKQDINITGDNNVTEVNATNKNK